MSNGIPTCAWWLLAALPLPAWALDEADFGGSPIAIGAGARALGMGGAFSAIADDATANSWNPAGMSQLERPEFATSAGWYANRNDRSDGSRDRQSALALDHVSAVLPFFAWGCQQTIGVGWQREFDFTRRLDVVDHEVTPAGGGLVSDFDSDAALRQRGSFASTSLSYAIELTPGLALGVTGKLWGERWTGCSSYRQDIDIASTNDFTIGGAPVGGIDTTIDGEKKVRIAHGFSVVAGAWIQATPDLAVALVYKPKYHLGLVTDTDLIEQDTLVGIGTSTTPTNDTSASRLTYPTSATAGLAWRQADTRTLALDVTWIHWQEYRIDEGGLVRSPVAPGISPADFSDTVAVRLGYEQLVICERWVAVARCGLLYEGLPGATKVPVAQADQARATTDHYVGGTVGMSACFRHLIYDLAAQVRYGHQVGAGQYAGPDQAVDLTTLTVRAGVAWQF